MNIKHISLRNINKYQLLTQKLIYKVGYQQYREKNEKISNLPCCWSY